MKMKTMMAVVLLASVFGAATALDTSKLTEKQMYAIPKVQVKKLTSAQILQMPHDALGHFIQNRFTWISKNILKEIVENMSIKKMQEDLYPGALLSFINNGIQDAKYDNNKYKWMNDQITKQSGGSKRWDRNLTSQAEKNLNSWHYKNLTSAQINTILTKTSTNRRQQHEIYRSQFELVHHLTKDQIKAIPQNTIDTILNKQIHGPKMFSFLFRLQETLKHKGRKITKTAKPETAATPAKPAELTIAQIRKQVRNARNLTNPQVNTILTQTSTDKHKQHGFYRWQFELVRHLHNDQIKAIPQDTIDTILQNKDHGRFIHHLQWELKRHGRKIVR
jgi:hypothetical protein